MQVTIHDEPAIRALVNEELDKRLAPQVLTLQEAADYLGIGLRTLTRWITQGRVPVTKVGRLVRIQRSALDELMSAR